ncbi:MAG: hypothetical protein U9R53_09385 [Chloroflexota bacterium]|nr:hypothetical protein [Chloroflexota bacterium]
MRKKKISTLLPIILFIGVLALSISGLILAQNLHKAEIKNQKQYSNQDDIPRVSIQEAYQAMINGEAVLVDTRSEAAFAEQHAAGAINLPIDQLESRLGELDPDIWYLTYCT